MSIELRTECVFRSCLRRDLGLSGNEDFDIGAVSGLPSGTPCRQLLLEAAPW